VTGQPERGIREAPPDARCSACERPLSAIPLEGRPFLYVLERLPDGDEIEHYFHSHLCLLRWARQINLDAEKEEPR